MDINELLCKDFLWHLRLVKHPAIVFRNDREMAELGQAWLAHLVGLKCSTIAEKRKRNKIMWEFSKCLEEGELSGIFLNDPKQLHKLVRSPNSTHPSAEQFCPHSNPHNFLTKSRQNSCSSRTNEVNTDSEWCEDDKALTELISVRSSVQSECSTIGTAHMTTLSYFSEENSLNMPTPSRSTFTSRTYTVDEADENISERLKILNQSKDDHDLTKSDTDVSQLCSAEYLKQRLINKLEELQQAEDSDSGSGNNFRKYYRKYLESRCLSELRNVKGEGDSVRVNRIDYSCVQQELMANRIGDGENNMEMFDESKYLNKERSYAQETTVIDKSHHHNPNKTCKFHQKFCSINEQNPNAKYNPSISNTKGSTYDNANRTISHYSHYQENTDDIKMKTTTAKSIQVAMSNDSLSVMHDTKVNNIEKLRFIIESLQVDILTEELGLVKPFTKVIFEIELLSYVVHLSPHTELDKLSYELKTNKELRHFVLECYKKDLERLLKRQQMESDC